MPEIRIDDDRWEPFVARHNDHRHHQGAHFLTWHSQYLAEFMELVESLPANERPRKEDIEPWPAIPQALKETARWDSSLDEREERLENEIESFDSLDDLANFINPLHGRMHGAAEDAYDDPHIASLENAPRSTYFWQLHGLVERWHQEWLNAPRDAPPVA